MKKIRHLTTDFKEILIFREIAPVQFTLGYSLQSEERVKMGLELKKQSNPFSTGGGA
ncbi:MAG: hypothetical protein KGO49_00690 [Gammaproteobacteria bacterium]|nr:hypothetical protein [Gammaproteobacteria bacterium]